MTSRMGSNESSATPPFVAGGGGFEYEDDVAAFVLAAMLAGLPPFGEAAGLVRRIDWQTKQDGWEFDDLLLTCCGADDRKIAISCKAGAYVTSRSWPNDAVQRLWRQKTRSAPNPFRESVDLLAVVTGSLAQGVVQTWDRVVQDAVNTDPHRFMERFTASGVSGENARLLVESLQCPPELAVEIGDEPSERAKLIRQVRLWRRDLRSLDSADVSRAVDYCRQALADGERETAVELYDKLRSLAAERRIRGGTLELRDLASLLADQYSLRCWPNHETAWKGLDSRSDEQLQFVSESIGNKMCLTQAGPMASLLSQAVAGHIVFIVGESGTGKSALAKRLALRHARTLWLSASDLDTSSLDAIAQGIGSSVPLTELLDQDRVPSAMLVIDGTERLSAVGRRNAARLIYVATKAARPWLVIVTTQEEGIDRLLVDLGREPVEPGAIRSIRVELPSEATVAALLPSLPIRFTANPSRSLLRALRNLKAMDWTVRTASQRELAGFPDFVEQVWNFFLGSEDANARANVLKVLGRADADSISGGTPSSMLTGAEDQRVAQALVNDGLLMLRNERYFFRHDLLGDWARLLLLVEKSEQANEYLKEVATNIRWAPAIRLFAEWLSQKGDAKRARLVRLLVAEPPHAASTSLLEGLFRSPDGGRVLDEVLSSTTLGVAGIAVMLRTFMAAATRPSNLSMVLRRDHPLGAAARASYRAPIPELWSSVTQTLEKHAATLASKVPVSLGHVARVWLLDRATAHDSVHAETSRVCAKLAVATSRELQARIAIAGWSDREEVSRVFEGLLLAAPWLSEDVAQIALEMSHRRPDPPAVVDRIEAERKQVAEAVAQRLSQMSEKEKARRRSGFSILPTQHRKREPFTDGPSARVNEAFRSAALDTAAIVQLAIHKPEAGHEVLLACCLEDPGQDDPLYLDFPYDDHAGTIDKVDWYPPLYLRGPWLPLLLKSPEQGLEAVLRLVGIGTAEWLRLNVPPEGADNHVWAVSWSTVVLQVGGESREFRGGAEVFGWYRGYGRAGNIVASALMALESWLYRCMDTDQPIDEVVEKIFESGQSVALLGVLAGLARRHQELLNGSLRPLMSSWMLLDWDDAQSVHAQMPDFDPLNLKALNTWIDDEAEKWSKLPHRAVRLPWVIATKLAIGEEAIIAECERARARWQGQIDSGTCLGADNAKRLIALLDPANLSLKRHEEGQVLVEVDWPPDLAEEYEERSRNSQPRIVAFQLRSTMRKLLEDGQPLNETQAEEVWRVASSLPADPPSAEELETNSPAVARAAAAAVLELLAAKWLDGFPDRRAWCESAVSDLAIDQPRRTSVIQGVSIHKEHAEAFTGEWAIARLAAGDERPKVRRILAQALTADEPIVIGQVMKAAVDVAEKLPNDFERLFNLVWLWCALRNLASGWRGDGEWGERIAKSRWQKLVQAFVACRIPNELMVWEDLRLRAARVRIRLDRRCRAKSPSWTVVEQAESSNRLSDDWYEYDNHGFNWSVLERVIEQLPVVVRPSQRSTLGPLAEFDRRLLDLVVFTLKRPPRVDRNRDSLPNQFDRLALSRLCLLIADHEDDVVALDICKQMMPLLPLYPKWCEAFFDAWFRRPREDDLQSKRFYRRWQSMIEMAESLPEWDSGGEQWSYDLAAARSALLGVHERGSQLGIQSDQSAISTLRSVYADWAERALTDRWRLRSFCSFLQKPGAIDLRLPALEWVRSALKRLSSFLESERELVLEVAGFCIVTWYQHRDQILAEPEARGAMVAIIQLLWQTGVQEIAEVKEELEAAMGMQDENKS